MLFHLNLLIYILIIEILHNINKKSSLLLYKKQNKFRNIKYNVCIIIVYLFLYFVEKILLILNNDMYINSFLSIFIDILIKPNINTYELDNELNNDESKIKFNEEINKIISKLNGEINKIISELDEEIKLIKYKFEIPKLI